MIPTFLIDEPFLVFLGLLAGFFVPKAWNASLFRTRAFWAGTWIALCFMGLALYGYLKAPDWMFMYFLPASRVPVWIVVYIFLFYYLLFVAGFLLHRELRKSSAYLAWIVTGIFLLASVAVVLPVLKEYQTVANYDAFHRGEGTALPESAVGKGTTLPAIGMVVSGIGLLIWARRQGRESKH